MNSIWMAPSPSRLAESVERSDDGLVYTYKIKDGIKWHDGQALTAEDVAFTYNLYKDTPEYPYLNGYYTPYFESIEATENNEVILTLTEAIPNIESQLVFLYILPKHIWEGVNKLEYENVGNDRLWSIQNGGICSK